MYIHTSMNTEAIKGSSGRTKRFGLISPRRAAYSDEYISYQRELRGRTKRFGLISPHQCNLLDRYQYNIVDN